MGHHHLRSNSIPGCCKWEQISSPTIEFPTSILPPSMSTQINGNDNVIRRILHIDPVFKFRSRTNTFCVVRRLSASNDQSQLAFLSNWIDVHIRDARDALRKPLLVTEFGKSSKDPGFSVGQRDALFKTVYSKIYWSARSGGSAAGGFFWQLLSEGMGSYGDGYEIVLSEGSSTARIIALQSRQLRYLGKWYARQRNVAKLNKAKAMREEERQRRASKAADAGN